MQVWGRCGGWSRPAGRPGVQGRNLGRQVRLLATSEDLGSPSRPAGPASQPQAWAEAVGLESDGVKWRQGGVPGVPVVVLPLPAEAG